MLISASEHYRQQGLIITQGVRAARSARGRGVTAAAAVVTAYQALAVRDASQAVERMLDEQEIDAPAVATVLTSNLVGSASDGRPLTTLLEQARTDWQFSLMVATQLKDLARMGAGTSMAARPNVTGYVRMIQAGACSRCAVLAGRRFKWNSGFERHPGCLCTHVPMGRRSNESELISHPDDYFESLPTAESLAERYPDLTVAARREAGLYSQEDIFTKSGARAIRDGADISQVVNVRSGMSTATIGGRQALVSDVGTTARGSASRAKTGRNMKQRLMPESIYANARSHEDAIRMLRLHGYIS